MGKKDPRVDAYIAKSQEFAKPILEHFRELVHKACPDVEETIKWGFASFDYKGPYCSMASFKQHCAIGFWKATLMKDTKLIANAKSESAMGHLGRITSLKDLPKDKELIAYLKEAAKLNADGVKLPAKPKSKEPKELVVPDYFTKALKKNKKALGTFTNFSYSRKKDYVEWITEAKTEETRNKRMATAIEWLAEGKSRNWKYEKC
ncbi:MAG: YdeI/OmpD-associated family protein [Ignavibacteriales bacterium]|nr:YdeI/OmpD-associated family protein [Ignavibacteriales bacterium]